MVKIIRTFHDIVLIKDYIRLHMSFNEADDLLEKLQKVMNNER